MSFRKYIKEYLFGFGRSPKEVRKEYDEKIKSIDENRRRKRIYKDGGPYCYAPRDYTKYQGGN